MRKTLSTLDRVSPAGFARLALHVGAPRDCWEWRFYRDRNGYGRLSTRVRGETCTVLAHRLAYEVLRGPIQSGLELDHLCKNPACINPRHLEPVTGKENNARSNSRSAINARKTHCRHGHPLVGRNVVLEKDGGRRCRQCSRDKQRARGYVERGTLYDPNRRVLKRKPPPWLEDHARGV